MFSSLPKIKNINIKAVYAAVILITLLAGSFFDVQTALAKVTPIADGGPEINSASAVVMDVNSGAVLYAKNPTEAHQPSSLTKLVTALVCAEKLDMSSPLTFSSNAASQDFPTASNAGFRNGDVSSVRDGITAMIMCSADDCAVALAEKCGADMTDFAELMNTYATANGYQNSSFKNSNGKHTEGHYTCAYDMALAGMTLMNTLPEFKSASSDKSAVVSSSGSSLRELTVNNTHKFIKGTDSYSYAYAGKTGGTAYGGDESWSLCTFASYKGLNLVCIIMGAPKNDTAYDDTKLLFDYAFENYTSVSAESFMTKGNSEIGTLFSNEIMPPDNSHASIYTDKNAQLVLPNNADTQKLSNEISFTQIHEYKYGENIIGRINFYYNGNFVGACNIIFYTENASMEQSEFNKYFPDFLLSPDAGGDNLYSDFGSTDETEKNGFFNKMKAGIYSLYTPAKFFAFICGLFIFFIGLLVIFLVFPTKPEKKDKLYRTNREDFVNPSEGDELSEVVTMRNPSVEDMHEIK